jgi:MoxR-like ATPase
LPNDLLNELDRMQFHIDETGEEVTAKHRPVVIITSNAEKELADAFLRRCVFHFIDFPSPELMQRIVEVHHPDVEDKLVQQAIEVFYEIRNMRRLRKRPSTSELIDWIAVLRRSGTERVELDEQLPFLGALLKKEQDLTSFADQLAGGRRWRPWGPDAPAPRAAAAERAGRRLHAARRRQGRGADSDAGIGRTRGDRALP